MKLFLITNRYVFFFIINIIICTYTANVYGVYRQLKKRKKKLKELASIYFLTKTRPVPNAAVTVPQIKKSYDFRVLPEGVRSTPDTPPLDTLSKLDTPAPEVMTIPETPPPAPEPSFILQEVLLEVPEAKPKIVKSSAVVSENSVKILNNEKDAYAAFKPVPAVPEGHVYR
jgi:hypothetical protein